MEIDADKIKMSNVVNPKAIRKITLEEEEDEETDQQNQYNQSRSQEQQKKKIKPCSSSKNRETTSDDEEIDESDEEDEQSKQEIPEMLVPNRTRRSNAGKKMQELLNQQIGQGDKDEFYINAYGGFRESDQDEEFESPPHSSDDGEEEVDSDFDKPEEDEINEEQTDNTIYNEERIERRKKKQKQKQLLERNNWAIARINKISVPENNCDPKTQQQRLEEAKNTAKANISSLKRFQEFELERKKRQTRAGPKKKMEGPRIREICSKDGKHFLILPEILPKKELFPMPERREFRICAVTGKAAHYMDPLTKLPYSDLTAFKIIRQKYMDYMAKTDKNRDDGSGGTIEVDKNFATPAKQKRLTDTYQLTQQQKHTYGLRQ